VITFFTKNANGRNLGLPRGLGGHFTGRARKHYTYRILRGGFFVKKKLKHTFWVYDRTTTLLAWLGMARQGKARQKTGGRYGAGYPAAWRGHQIF
jgi:hypothetical protein